MQVNSGGSSGPAGCDLQQQDCVISPLKKKKKPKTYSAQIDCVASSLLRPTGQRNGHN